jgi:hypothetical protein
MYAKHSKCYKFCHKDNAIPPPPQPEDVTLRELIPPPSGGGGGRRDRGGGRGLMRSGSGGPGDYGSGLQLGQLRRLSLQDILVLFLYLQIIHIFLYSSQYVFSIYLALYVIHQLGF